MGSYLSFFSNECDEVIPGLYIGHVGCATDRAMLSRRKITHIVDVSAREFEAPADIVMLRIPIPDVPEFDIRQIFALTNAFIDSALHPTKPPMRNAGTSAEDSEGRRGPSSVLVHCAWGISRSASVVLAYLMAVKRMSLDDAMALLKRQRPMVNPNQGFMRFLRLYDQELNRHRTNCPSCHTRCRPTHQTPT